MSYQAMGAVQEYSRYAEDDPQNFAPFKIMLALAWFSSADGIVGTAGDPRKCPGHRAIADRARVHRNTVGKWLSLIIEDGELEVVDTGGHGRGSWTQYRILLPIEETAVFVPENSRHVMTPLELLAHEMAQGFEKMAHEMAQGFEKMAQGNGTNGTRGPEVAQTDPCDPINPDPEQEEEGGDPPSPLPPPDIDDLALWQSTVDLVERWTNRRGIYRRLNPSPGPKEPDDYGDFFAPALHLVQEFSGDVPAAFTAVWQAYQAMLTDGFTAVRLAPVAAQVLANLDRQQLPARASPNGQARQMSRAEAAAAEYAAMKELMNHERN